MLPLSTIRDRRSQPQWPLKKKAAPGFKEALEAAIKAISFISLPDEASRAPNPGNMKGAN